jgi:hypothetical protein
MIHRHSIRDDDDWDDHLSMFRGDKRMLIPKLRGDLVDQKMNGKQLTLNTTTDFDVAACEQLSDGTMALSNVNCEGMHKLGRPHSSYGHPDICFDDSSLSADEPSESDKLDPRWEPPRKPPDKSRLWKKNRKSMRQICNDKYSSIKRLLEHLYRAV